MKYYLIFLVLFVPIFQTFNTLASLLIAICKFSGPLDTRFCFIEDFKKKF